MEGIPQGQGKILGYVSVKKIIRFDEAELHTSTDINVAYASVTIDGSTCLKNCILNADFLNHNSNKLKRFETTVAIYVRCPRDK